MTHAEYRDWWERVARNGNPNIDEAKIKAGRDCIDRAHYGRKKRAA
jgi:hypothetical protein